MDWSEILRMRRKALKLTQAQLAKAIGVSTDAVSSWESARRRPSRSMLARLAAVLGMGEAEQEGFVRSTGHDPGSGSRYAALAKMSRPLAWLAGEIAEHRFPTLITNERYEIVAWNQAANVVAELDFADLDGPQERQLLLMAATPHFFQKLTNWDDVIGRLITFYKNDNVTLGDAAADPYFGALIERIIRDYPALLARLFGLFESAAPYEEAARNQVSIEWLTSDGTKLRFMGVFGAGSEFDAAWVFDWHPLDGATWDWLNAHWDTAAPGGDEISLETAVDGWRGILRRAREVAGLSREELARQTDGRVAPATIESYERGLRQPSREKLVAIADALRLQGAHTNAILAGAGMEPEPSDFARLMMGEPLRYRPTPTSLITAKAADFYRDEAELQPFPNLQIDKNADIVAANAPMRRLLGIPDEALLQDRVERNLIYALATGPAARHIGNWEEVMAAMAPIGAEPYIDIAKWTPPDGSLARAIKRLGDFPEALARLQTALRRNPFHGRAGVHCRVRWDADGEPLVFDCVVSSPNLQAWTWRVDWHPADGATWAWVEAG